MSKDKVLVVDDHPIVRQGVKDILHENFKMDIVGEAATGREAIDLAKSLRPNIIIIDVSMPDINGVEAVLEIKKILDDVIIIVYSMYSDRDICIHTKRRSFVRLGPCNRFSKERLDLFKQRSFRGFVEIKEQEIPR